MHVIANFSYSKTILLQLCPLFQMNQQYLMNISKYPHPWRSEKNAYIILLERQKLANKAVNVSTLYKLLQSRVSFIKRRLMPHFSHLI